MTYLVIAEWDVDRHPTKIKFMPNETAADNHVSVLMGKGYTDAFHVADYTAGHDMRYVVVNAEVDGVVIDTAGQSTNLLETAKSTRKKEVQALSNAKSVEDFTYDTGTHSNDVTYHMGKTTQVYYIKLEAEGGTQDTYAKDTYVKHTLTNTAMSEFVNAVVTRSKAIALQRSVHVVAIDALTTVAAVKAYDISVDW